jgi:hypothetical protein
MIRVEGKDTKAAIMRARDHTQDTEPLILEIAVTLLLGCPLARDEHIHYLKQSGKGAESYSLQLSDGRQYHFRPRPRGHDADRIDVFDKYQRGRLVTTLATPPQIWKFFDDLAV